MTTETSNTKIIPPVNVYLPKERLVDIIIPFHGCCEHVQNLIENIFRFSPNFFDKIILIDDCSYNSEFSKIYSENNRFKIFRNKKHVGFGASINQGIEISDKQIVTVLHSDILFSDKNSLINLYNDFIFMRKESVGIITAVSDNPLVHEKILKKNKVTNDLPEIVKELYIPMYCCIVDVAAWRVVGGIPEFPLAWFEDEGFCYKLKKIGYNLAVSHKSFVKHLGGQTIKQIVNKNKNLLNIMKLNINLLDKIKK